MTHTKNILKSLLITVMALSLLAVSCKKDENGGGGKTPTNPTTTTISASDLTSTIKGLEATKVNFSTMTDPSSGTASISGADKVFDDVKSELTTLFTALAANNLVEVTTDIDSVTKPSASEALKVTLTMKAKSGFQFASDMTGYTYNDTDKTVKLEISITPTEAWQ